jgi:hypothetical protein
MLPPGSGRCDDSMPCAKGSRCINNVCVTDHGTCKTDDDCQDDTYCACPPQIKSRECACIPWGMKPRGDHDDMCVAQGFAPGEFKAPTLKCQWPAAGAPSYKDVLATPLVVDLDRDGQPEVVFAAGYIGQVHLLAISGKDCSVKFDKAVNIAGCSDLAVGDLDGDKLPEIVAMAPGISVYDNQGNLKAQSSEPMNTSCSQLYSPAIANLDGAGPPEIIAGGVVARYEGGMIRRLWSNPAAGKAYWGLISIAEDLDGDGKLEVISGNKVFDGMTGADKSKPVMAGLEPGYPAIGDFNMDGHPDIVLISSRPNGQKAAVIDWFNNQFIMPPQAAPMGWGGAPTVADFDGDGRPEFATASAVSYYVYSPDCAQNPRPPKCKGTDAGVLWQSRTQDGSSGSTGSSVFDFNGDKIAEVVYRDECWLRVYSGPDGRKLFAAPVSSGTGLELPVVADTDGDGHADIVVPADSVQGDNCNNAVSSMELGMPHGPPTFGVKIYKDPMDRWMPSRGIWNQHSYHITNVNDDATIPLVEMPNFKTFNNYRQNVQGMASATIPSADATGAILISPDTGDCVTVHRLWANICNRGAAPLGAGVPGTFYVNDPRKPGSMAICTARTTMVLPPGKCQPVTCDYKNPPRQAQDLRFRVNDDGMGGRPFGQCKSGNDLARLPGSTCSMIPG